MPITSNVLVATYADDTTILASSPNPTDASNKIQKELNDVEKWLNKWKIQVNTEKSTHVTFTLRRENVILNNCSIPQSDSVKYLGLHIDRRLTWKTHIQANNI